MPSYARFLRGNVDAPLLPDALIDYSRPVSLLSPTVTTPMATCVAATFDPASVRQWLPESHWQFVQVLSSMDLFRQHVLLPGPIPDAQHPPRVSRVSRPYIQELASKGYMRRRHAKPLFVCHVFAVWKSDRMTLRLIWNGIPFNLLCRPPPVFTITPLHLMLAKLLAPDVKRLMTFDFSTWFVQIIVCDEVSRFFAVRFPSGEVWHLMGVPMGWSWACAIAHALTQAIARRIVSRLGLASTAITCEFCIDNTIMAIRNASVSRQQLESELALLQKDLGVVVKPSATEYGLVVDWLPYSLNVSTGTATWKTSVRSRLRQLADRASVAPSVCPLLDVWRASGLLIWCIYAALRPLTLVSPLLLWLCANTPRTLEGWGATVDFPLWALIRVTATALTTVVVTPPPLPSTTTRAWFVSDAATSGLMCYILFTRRYITMVAWPPEKLPPGAPPRDIASLELEAHVKAARAAIREPEHGDVVGFGDNSVAQAAQRRGYAIWEDGLRQRAVEHVRAEYMKLRSTLFCPQVKSALCLADMWTRGTLPQSKTTTACPTHPYTPGFLCPCMIALLKRWAPVKQHHTIDSWVETQTEWSTPSDGIWDWWGTVPGQPT
jgi:hypothetical protein